MIIKLSFTYSAFIIIRWSHKTNSKWKQKQKREGGREGGREEERSGEGRRKEGRAGANFICRIIATAGKAY